MTSVPEFIESLRIQSGISITDQPESWLVHVSRGAHLIEVTVPKRVLEWFASMRSRDSAHPIWSDWMDYEAYDNRPRRDLEMEMIRDIANFIDRALETEDIESLQIYQEGD